MSPDIDSIITAPPTRGARLPLTPSRPTAKLSVEMGTSGARAIRYDLARDRALGLLTLTRQRPPVDMDAIIERTGVPVVERVLVDGIRGTIGDVAGRRTIILTEALCCHTIRTPR